MTLLALTFLAAAPFIPAPTDYVSLHPAKASPGDLRASGKVEISAKDAGAGAPPEFALTVGKGPEARLVLPAGVAPPFAAGDEVQLVIARTGGWHVLYTGALTAKDGALLVAVSRGGRSPLPEGWEVERGPLERTEKKTGRTTRHFFTVIRRGAEAVRVPSGGWLTFEAGGSRYLAWGAAEDTEWTKDQLPDDAVGEIDDWAIVRLGVAPPDAGVATDAGVLPSDAGVPSPKGRR